MKYYTVLKVPSLSFAPQENVFINFHVKVILLFLDKKLSDGKIHPNFLY